MPRKKRTRLNPLVTVSLVVVGLLLVGAGIAYWDQWQTREVPEILQVGGTKACSDYATKQDCEAAGCFKKFYSCKWDNRQQKCAQRYNRSCGTSPKFTETCTGTCYKGISACAEKNLASLGGSCFQGICCGAVTGGGGQANCGENETYMGPQWGCVENCTSEELNTGACYSIRVTGATYYCVVTYTNGEKGINYCCPKGQNISNNGYPEDPSKYSCVKD